MAGNQTEYAVVDVETTGFGKQDRVVEIGIVVLDHDFQKINEYETLIDPERDLGATHVHFITPQMLSMAPRFEDVAQAIAKLLNGRILVAHNLSFDQRFLKQEFERLKAAFDPGKGVCTYKLTNDKLPEACATYGVQLPEHHRALADSRACASLLQQFEPDSESCAATINRVATDPSIRTHRRCATQGIPPMERMYCYHPLNKAEDRVGQYHGFLDWTLDRLTLDSSKQHKLDCFAKELDLSAQQILEAHKQYIQSLAFDAKRNGVITKAERKLLAGVAKSLGVSAQYVPKATVGDIDDENIPAGAAVCFTGSVVDRDGCKVSRAELSRMAIDRGLVVAKSVTKSGCDVVVAVDVSSSSGKAKKARELGKPVISSDRFLQLMQSDPNSSVSIPAEKVSSEAAYVDRPSSDLTEVRPSATTLQSSKPPRPSGITIGFEIRPPLHPPADQPTPSDPRRPMLKTNFPSDTVAFFGKGQEIQLGKAKLKSCYVYGTKGGAAETADASLIDASLPLSKPNGSEDDGLPYWPSYLSCTAVQRYQYLHWLTKGRRDPNVELGYVFIYFYGLERRVLVDQKDLMPIAHELIRLLMIYGQSNSFRRYATNLLWTSLYLASTKEKVAAKLLSNAIKVTKKWTDQSLGLCLGILQTLGYRLPIRLARAIAERDVRTASSVIVGRHREEFRKLFKLKYLQQFEKGMPLVAAKRAKTVDYYPASATLHRFTRKLSNLPKCPNVMGKPAQFKPLVSIWNDSIESLKGFNRASKKSAGEMTTVVYEALPVELREQQHPEFASWMQVWESNVDENGWPIVKISDLAAIKGMAARTRLIKAECNQLLSTADAMGFAIEPDVRLTGEKYYWDEKVTLYCCEGPAFEDANGYSAASILMRLGANIAEADGVIDPRELRYISEHLQSMFDFSEVDSKRLESLQYLLLKSRSGDTSIGKTLARKLSRKHRQVVGEFLVGIAASDEAVCEAEIAALRVAYQTLEIDEKELDRLLLPHQQTTDSVADEVSTAIQIDHAAVSKIMAETKQVAKLLRDAMADDVMADDASKDLPHHESDHEDGTSENGAITDVFIAPQTKSNHAETVSETISAANTDASADVPATPREFSAASAWPHLSSRLHPLLQTILQQDEWSIDDFQQLCARHAVMQSGAIEVINEWSTEQFGDWLIEEDDCYIINKHILTETEMNHDS